MDWTRFYVRKAIHAASQSLGLSERDFHEVEKGNYERITRQITDRFVSRPDANWWWEHFKGDVDTIALPPSRSFKETLPPYCPAGPHETVYFLAEEIGERPKKWLYAGTFDAVLEVLEHTIEYEFYIVSKKLN